LRSGRGKGSNYERIALRQEVLDDRLNEESST
jgi:hypothetical protein